jgi:hypothetical protein
MKSGKREPQAKQAPEKPRLREIRAQRDQGSDIKIRAQGNPGVRKTRAQGINRKFGINQIHPERSWSAPN